MTSTLTEIMQSLPSMSAGYIRPVSPDFIEEVLQPDGATSAFDMDDYDFDVADYQDEDPSPTDEELDEMFARDSADKPVYVRDSNGDPKWSLREPYKHRVHLAWQEHSALTQDNEDDEFAPHPHAHPKLDIRRGQYSKSNKMRRKEPNWFASSARERIQHRWLRPERLALRGEKEYAHAVFAGSRHDTHGWYPSFFQEEEPIPLDVTVPADWQDNAENIAGDLSFEDINRKWELNLRGGWFNMSRYCCGSDHESNYHEVMKQPTGRILFDQIESYLSDIHADWAHLLPKWSFSYGDTNYMKEETFGYDAWFPRLRYLVLMGKMSLRDDHEYDPHLSGGCNCWNYSRICCSFDKLFKIVDTMIEEAGAFAQSLADWSDVDSYLESVPHPHAHIRYADYGEHNKKAWRRSGVRSEKYNAKQNRGDRYLTRHMRTHRRKPVSSSDDHSLAA